MARTWGVLAGLLGALGVGVAAWASHGLPHMVAPEQLEKALEMAHAATQQHLLHVVALLAVAVWSRLRPGRWLDLAGVLFTTGIVLFGMGIYVLHLWWPAWGQGSRRYLVPVGGVCLMLGWLALVPAALERGTLRR